MTTAAPALWLDPQGRPLAFVAAPVTLPSDQELEAIVYGSAPWPLHPPASFFAKPGWLKPGQKLTVVTDGAEAGRVAGYVAPWGQCLLGGDPNQCFTAPSSPTGYRAAMQGDTLTAEGGTLKTANIGGGINHAPINPGTFNQRVVDHYANTASQLMRVVYGEDEYGIWAAGALWPEVTERDVATIRASALSGDWRWRPEYQAHDMAGVQLVNVPGYPLIRGVSAACETHPILIGGMGGVPADQLEEDPMDHDSTAAAGQALGGGFVAGVAEGEPRAAAAGEAVAACACQTVPVTAATTDVPAPGVPAQEPDPVPADEAITDERDQRIADLEGAVAELSAGLRECQGWIAEFAASAIDQEDVSLPEDVLV